MGSRQDWSLSPRERDAIMWASTRHRNAEVAAAERLKETKRMELADKIALMVSNKIEQDLIRPGPVAEERECYDMAAELREMRHDLAKVVTAVLKAEGVEIL